MTRLCICADCDTVREMDQYGKCTTCQSASTLAATRNMLMVRKDNRKPSKVTSLTRYMQGMRG